MNFKQALICCLVLIAAFVTAVERNPICAPEVKDVDREANFLFFVDKTLDAPILQRLVYLIKSISCEIPLNKKILSIVSSFTGTEASFSDAVTSDRIPEFIYGSDPSESKGDNCFRFGRALGRAPPAFLEKENVQFIVPIIDDDPECNMLTTFQQHFKNDPRKANYFFNGILINSEATEKNNQSIRVVVPDLAQEIDLNEASLTGSEKVADVYKHAPLVESYSKMIRDILEGRSIHDWDIPDNSSTTSFTTESTTSSLTSSLPTTSLPILAKENDIDDDAMMLIGGANENTETSTANTTTFPVNTTSMETNTSSTSHSSTFSTSSSSSVSTTTSNRSTDFFVIVTGPLSKKAVVTSSLPSATSTPDYDEDLLEELDSDVNLNLTNVRVKGEKGDDKELTMRTTTELGTIGANTLLFILILLLILWLICLILCLVWIFYCAKKKVDKLEDEAEAQQDKTEEKVPLLENGPQQVFPSKPAEGADEPEDEWKNIQPVKYSDAPQSEAESVHQPSPAARYQPVEVSELEQNNDDEVDERPRHGYLPPKKTADLQFD